jgi:hypothetical protein
MIDVKIAGRGFGKTATYADELLDEAHAAAWRMPVPRPLRGLDSDELAMIRARNSTLRQGLPGDGTPTTRKEAKARCPHRVLVHTPIGLPSMPWTVSYLTSRVPAGEHDCIGGWPL